MLVIILVTSLAGSWVKLVATTCFNMFHNVTLARVPRAEAIPDCVWKNWFMV